jgi:hypothetical protein
MVPACEYRHHVHLLAAIDRNRSYNGTSDLQLERMNVYFNEVRLR